MTQLNRREGSRLEAGSWRLRFQPETRSRSVVLQLGKEAGDLLRVVLEVAVHGDDQTPGAVVEAGTEGGGLAEVAAQADQLDPGVPLARLPHPPGRAVGRAVVHEDDLERAAEPVEHDRDPPRQLLHRLRLVEHRDQDADVHLLGNGSDRWRVGRLAEGDGLAHRRVLYQGGTIPPR